jgi:hypothetical protein
MGRDLLAIPASTGARVFLYGVLTELENPRRRRPAWPSRAIQHLYLPSPQQLTNCPKSHANRHPPKLATYGKHATQVTGAAAPNHFYAHPPVGLDASTNKKKPVLIKRTQSG